MFGIDSGELIIIAVVALVVIGPKDLPRVMRTLGNFIGRARGMARHFRSGIDTMIRESELEDMEKQWQANNDRIMREHPPATSDGDWGKAGTPEPPPAAPPSAELPSPEPIASDTRPKAPPRRPSRKRPAASGPSIPAPGSGAPDETQ